MFFFLYYFHFVHHVSNNPQGFDDLSYPCSICRTGFGCELLWRNIFFNFHPTFFDIEFSEPFRDCCEWQWHKTPRRHGWEVDLAIQPGHHNGKRRRCCSFRILPNQSFRGSRRVWMWVQIVLVFSIPSLLNQRKKDPCIPYEMTGPQKTGFFSGFHPIGVVSNEVKTSSIHFWHIHFVQSVICILIAAVMEPYHQWYRTDILLLFSSWIVHPTRNGGSDKSCKKKIYLLFFSLLFNFIVIAIAIAIFGSLLKVGAEQDRNYCRAESVC